MPIILFFISFLFLPLVSAQAVISVPNNNDLLLLAADINKQGSLAVDNIVSSKVLAHHLSIGFSQEKIVLQLKWKHAFQFAGYYAAQELGYYNDAGLDVDIRAASPRINPVEEVVNGRAQYGVGNSSLLVDRQNGKPVVVLNVVFQHSSAILITRGDKQIGSIKDLIGKRVMIEPNSSELLAYLKKMGIPLEQIQIIDHSYDVSDLIQGNVDAISAYSSNEPYLLNQQGFFFKEFTPREAGIDFYGDNLFTTEDQINSHPEQVEAFRAASMKGWSYAMEHQDEVIELILKKYGEGLERRQLLFEAQMMNNLLVNNLIEVGHMNPERWRRIVAAYKTLGQIQNDNILDGFIYKSHGGLLGTFKANFLILLEYLVGVFLLMAFLIYRNHQLRILNQKIEKMVIREKQQRQNQSTFLTMVTHEFRTPLAEIDSAIQMINLSAVDSSIAQRHHQIQLSVAYLNELLENTLAAERIDNEPLQPELKIISLAPFIETLLQRVMPSHGHYHSDIPSYLLATLDPHLFYMALSTLVVNAVKYSPKDSEISLQVETISEQAHNSTLVTVSNHYISSDKPDLSKWFEKYFRMPNQSNIKGFGLGLYLVTKIVDAHHGQIRSQAIATDKGWKISISLLLPVISSIKAES